jgi:hypothetical protein
MQSPPASLSFVGVTTVNPTSQQLDAYIDPSIQGQDRVKARRFLAFMPVGMRGDFVYIKSDGTMFSNNRAVLNGARLVTGGSVIPFHMPMRSAASAGRPANPESVVAPPFGGTTGPYAREFSQLGIDAAFAYATIDCNDYYLDNPSDYGFMYLGGFGNEGNGSGIDAGLQMSPLGSIQPFVSVSALGGNQGLTYYPTTHYPCGGNGVGMIYGGLPPPSSGQMFFGSGQPPYPSQGIAQPPSSVTWSNPAWTYWDTPTDFSDPGPDSTGAQSPCQSCITKRMTTISGLVAQALYSSDECFGACNGQIANRWDQVEMGELTSTCPTEAGPSVICTITFQANDSWFGAYQFYPDQQQVEVDENSPNNAYEGIDQSQDDIGQGSTRRTRGGPAGTFVPYAPIPTPTPTVPPCPKTVPAPCNGCKASNALGGGFGGNFGDVVKPSAIPPENTCPIKP